MMTTTDLPRRVLSARGRIVGWMLLLVTVALTGSVLIAHQVVHVRVGDLVNDRLTHAAQSIRTFASSPSGRSQATVSGLLTRYLEDTVPSSGETAFSVVDGAPQRRSAADPPVRLDRDAAFVRRVAGAREPASGKVATSAGPAHYAVVPVTVAGDPSRGVLVTIVFEDALSRPLDNTVRIVAVVAAIALVLAGLASWLVAGRVLEPVRLVRQAAEQISESDLRRRIPVTGHDDVARLASTFNRMLDRLEQAFAAQRQFVDDAGHELRTPITVVRGHLELLDDNPADRQRALGLVLDELARMNRIVDDLLLLAKAERPDFLRLDQVIVPDLTVDVVAKARTLGPRQWAIEEMADVVVLADGQRLTQALMQLATNAVQHTDSGDRIGVGTRVDDGRLLLWVRDRGSGVAAADRERIFERFQRAEGSRREGAGLGLAIVRSIARAHAGEVHLDSVPGRGSRFTINLPLHLVEPADDLGDVASTVVSEPPSREEARR